MAKLIFLMASCYLHLASTAVIRKSSTVSSSWLGRSLRLTGNYLPLRGVAGLATDLGVPGSYWLRDTLDWREDIELDMKEELLFAAGAVMGVEDCAKKFSCRMGKRISGLPGLGSTTVFLSGALPYTTIDLTTYMPGYIRDQVMVLRDSVLYSDDCEQYKCNIS